jgi:hypothetical protein
MTRTKYHYVYKIEFKSGHFYYGKRSTYNLPEKDVNYWGTPSANQDFWKDKNNTKTKVIIKTHNSEINALKHEGNLINESWKNNPDLCLNRTSYTGGLHPDLRNQERNKSGRFESTYSNLGDTGVMRIPRSCQKYFKTILEELNSLPDSIDPDDILSELVDGLSDRISSISHSE